MLALAPSLLMSLGMRRYIAIALLTACSSPDSDPGADAAVTEIPDDLAYRTYVIDDLQVPSTSSEATQFGLDLDGDGAIDNKLGTVITALASLNVDAPAMVTRAVDHGDTILLAKIGTTSFLDARVATFETFAGANPSIEPCNGAGDTTCRKHLAGGATFTVMPEPVGKPVVGNFNGGQFSGTAGNLVVRVDLLGSTPIDLVLLGSRAVLTMTTDSTIGSAKIAGAVSLADIESKVLPAVQANMSATVADECTNLASPPACGCPTGSDGKSALALFDKAPVDCAISLDEIKASALIQNLLEPDVTVEGEMALSLGVGATAVTANFAQ